MSDPNRFDGGIPTAGQATSTMEPTETPTIAPAPTRPREPSRKDARPDETATPRRNLLEDVTLERPRTHPVAYAALAVAVLALLVSLLGLRGGGDSGYRPVKVGTNDCVIGHQGQDNVLFCRAPAAP